jgi:hypothetical protein
LALALRSSRERIRSGTRLDWFANFRLASNCRPRICCCAVGNDLIGDLLPFIKVAHASRFDRADSFSFEKFAAPGKQEQGKGEGLGPQHAAQTCDARDLSSRWLKHPT